MGEERLFLLNNHKGGPENVNSKYKNFTLSVPHSNHHVKNKPYPLIPRRGSIQGILHNVDNFRARMIRLLCFEKIANFSIYLYSFATAFLHILSHPSADTPETDYTFVSQNSFFCTDSLSQITPNTFISGAPITFLSTLHKHSSHMLQNFCIGTILTLKRNQIQAQCCK